MATVYCNPDLDSGDQNGNSEANAWRTVEAAFDGVNGGDHCYIKKCSSRIDGGAIDVPTGADGTATAMTIFEGYTTTPGDNGRFEYANQIIIKSDMTVFKNWDIEDSQASTSGVLKVDNSATAHIHNCKIVNTHSGNYMALSINHSAIVTQSEIIAEGWLTTAQRGAVTCTNNDQIIIDGCVIRGYKGIGGTPGVAGFVVTNNVFYAPTTRAMYYAMEIDFQSSTLEVKTGVIANNTIYMPSGASHAIVIKELPDLSEKSAVFIANNVIWGDGSGNAISNTDTTTTVGPVIMNNATGNWTASGGVTGFGASVASYGNIELTADPFVDGAGGDFRLNGAAGGGAACRAAAYPTAYEGLTAGNRRDIGAYGMSGLIERISVS